MSRRISVSAIVLSGILLGLGAITPVPAQTDNSGSGSAENKAIAPAMSPENTPPEIIATYVTIQADFQTVKPLFQRGCFDCHSAQTRYPWYHKIPLVKGLIDRDIREARKRLDFTDGFPFKGKARPADNLLDIRNELEEGEMPPLLYRMMHWSAKPSATERATIFTWIDNSLRLLAAHGQYPFDRPDLLPGQGEGKNESEDSDDD